MNTSLRLLLAGCTALPLVAGCGQTGFKSKIPARKNVLMNVPSNDGQALTAGDQSNAYLLTYRTALSVNTPVAEIFDVIDAVVAVPPTTQNDDISVWGPSEARGLEALSYRFTVESGDGDAFNYKLEARKKDATAEEDFVVIFDGAADPGDDENGKGTLNWHLGARRSLIVTDCDVVGDIAITYDASVEPRSLDVVFTDVADECQNETPHDAHYTYTEAADASGSLAFAIEGNIHQTSEEKPELEVLSIYSRWLTDGTGRSDLRITGGEVETDLQALPLSDLSSVDLVECWDASFIVTYTDTTPDALEEAFQHAESGDAALCPYADAEFAEL